MRIHSSPPRHDATKIIWEGTVQQHVAASPETTSLLKKKGETVPASFTQPYRKCIDRMQWMKTKAAISTAPQGCAFIHKASTAKSLISSVRCEAPDGTSILIDANIAWDAGVRTRASKRMDNHVSRYHGKDGA